jgi:hypothetical protein
VRAVTVRTPRHCGIPQSADLAVDGISVSGQLALMTGTAFLYQPQFPTGLVHVGYQVFFMAVVTDSGLFYLHLKKNLRMNAPHVLFVLLFMASGTEEGNVLPVHPRLRILRGQDVMRTMAGLANRGIFYAFSDGLTVDAQPILFGGFCRRPKGARQMTDTAVHLFDFFMRIGDHIEVAAVAWTHAVNRFGISSLI